MPRRILHLASLVLVVIFASVGLTRAQSQVSTPINAPPQVNIARISPQHVVYLGPWLERLDAGDNDVLLDASGSRDPEGGALEYGFDIDGDGIFTDYSGLRADARARIVYPGAFTAAVRVRDEAGLVAMQEVNMVARQFTSHFADVGDLSFPSLAEVAGRPAIAYQEVVGGVTCDTCDGGIKFAINDQADGGGEWKTALVVPNSQVTCPCPLAVIGGRPVIAYTDPVKQDVSLAISSRADGSGEWVLAPLAGPAAQAFPAIIEAGGGMTLAWYNAGWLNHFRTSSLAELSASSREAKIFAQKVGDYPAGSSSMALAGYLPTQLATTYLDGNTLKLMYAVNDRVDGQGKWQYVTIQDAPHAYAPSLAMLDAGPAILYRDYDSYRLMLAVAKTPDGRGDWQVGFVAGGEKNDRFGNQQLAAQDGRAAVVFDVKARGVIFGYQDAGELWDFVRLEGVGAMSPSLAVIAGRPAVAWRAANGQGIKFAIAR